MERTATTKRIVVGVDASDESDVALREGLRAVASLPDAELHLVHAARPYVMPPLAMGEVSGYQTGQAHAEMLRSLPSQYWDKAVKLAREERIVPQTDEVEVHVRVGAAPEVLLDVAADVGADLVIVGSHGRSGLSRAVMGSVSERVVRAAECPVFVARSGSYQSRDEDQDQEPTVQGATAQPAPPARLTPRENFAYRTRRRVQWDRGDPDVRGRAPNARRKT